jgi:hypothetical protein
MLSHSIDLLYSNSVLSIKSQSKEYYFSVAETRTEIKYYI